MIRAEHVWRKFGRFDALRGLDLSVPVGSAFALVGANGAGKTTTIKVLMNILEPTRGTATVMGVESVRLSTKELTRIGYVSENQKMPECLTVAEIRYFGPSSRLTRRGIDRHRLGCCLTARIRDRRRMRMKMALRALPFVHAVVRMSLSADRLVDSRSVRKGCSARGAI
jgi:ABC-2 type transport system ATP-binding protein